MSKYRCSNSVVRSAGPESSRSVATPAMQHALDGPVTSDASGRIAWDLSLPRLREQLALAAQASDEVYAYVVATVSLKDGMYHQGGSAPNWSGDVLTLTTCKHDMRASLPGSRWPGRWVLMMTGCNAHTQWQQSVVGLMQVGEAYGSHAHLREALLASGRTEVVEAKDATRHRLGDLMMARERGLPAKPNDPAAYLVPCQKHAHHKSEDDDYWHGDIRYQGRNSHLPSLLVGAAGRSFVWRRPMVRRIQGGVTRPYRCWSMAQLLEELCEVAA